MKHAFIAAATSAVSVLTFAGFDRVTAAGAPLPYTTLATIDDVVINHGGYGSSAYRDPSDPNRFYTLTDRGPNIKSRTKGEKVFLLPEYRPAIGQFAVSGDGRIKLLREISLLTAQGTPITGLPNPEGYGATGETAVDRNGGELGSDINGLDGEGLVVMPDGSFWVADEYGPHIVHFTEDGRQLERISPWGLESNSGRLTLPAVLATRRPNRGMEGLALTPDGKTLVGIIQSTLYNPSKSAVGNKTLTRIVTLDLSSGESHQYLYRQDKANHSNSEIRALDANRFLVAERDGKMLDADRQAEKKIYLIDLSGASDVNGNPRAKNGRLINGKTLEQSDWAALEKAGIEAVTKTLIVDLTKTYHYPHDKFEGMFFVGKDHRRLAILNDDDFAVDSGKDGAIREKRLAGTGKRDAATLYVIPIALDGMKQ